MTLEYLPMASARVISRLSICERAWMSSSAPSSNFFSVSLRSASPTAINRASCALSGSNSALTRFRASKSAGCGSLARPPRKIADCPRSTCRRSIITLISATVSTMRAAWSIDCASRHDLSIRMTDTANNATNGAARAMPRRRDTEKRENILTPKICPIPLKLTGPH